MRHADNGDDISSNSIEEEMRALPIAAPTLAYLLAQPSRGIFLPASHNVCDGGAAFLGLRLTPH